MITLQAAHSDHIALQEQLADVKERVDSAKRNHAEKCEQLLRQWESNNAELLEEFAFLSEKAATADADLRSMVKAAYLLDTTKKTVAPGLFVRVTKKPVYEAEKAFQWAMEHKLALMLDKKTFEKVAASTTDMDFVTYDEEITAVIAKAIQ